jgi:alpha-D-ribose 1-methylphosphonate 5-triphosphate synthase subunit PhnG
MSQTYSYEEPEKRAADALKALGRGCPEECLERREWMSALAGAGLEALEGAFAGLAGELEYKLLRRPEMGLMMMQARTGNNGRLFNLGEVLVTRCLVGLRLKSGGRAAEGYAMVLGENFRQAELAAVFDALLQTEWHASIMSRLIEPLHAARRGRELAKNEKTRRTKVDFYTLAHGED